MQTPVDYIPTILRRVKVQYIQKQYNLPDWIPNPADGCGSEAEGRPKEQKLLTNDSTEVSSALVVSNSEEGPVPSHISFLSMLAVKMGKLLKGSEPDLRRVAVMIINDWQRVSSFMINIFL